MNAHLDETWLGETFQPFIVNAERTNTCDLAHVNSHFIGSYPNLAMTNSAIGEKIQNNPTKSHDMSFNVSK